MGLRARLRGGLMRGLRLERVGGMRGKGREGEEG